MTKGNSGQTTGSQAQDWVNPLSGLDRIRQAARRDRGQRFTSLMHHLTAELLLESYRGLKKDAAAGVDEVTWREYEDGLTARVLDLHKRVQSGRYRAKPSKRIYLPKPDGRLRPIGIASLEDKIVQAAVVRVLEQIYEEDFLGFSYGYRPRRSQHHALDAVWVGINSRKINWILDADLRNFFDSIDHTWMLRFLEHRIADRRILRLIRKWLRAGISEDGQWSRLEKGTAQGSVISPLLANVYLHYSLDQWVQQWRKQARGDVIIVRYADDLVMGFQCRPEAVRFRQEMKARLAKFGLELNEAKTRLIEFGRFADADRRGRGEGKPETFNFLGMTHACSKTRRDGRFLIRRQPVGERIRRRLGAIKVELRRRMHEPIAEQGRWLRAVVQGLYNYYAVPGTTHYLNGVRCQVNKLWLRTLQRRSHKGRGFPWARMQPLLDVWIPKVRILHPYPPLRLRV